MVQLLHGRISFNNDYSWWDRDIFRFSYLVKPWVLLVDDHDLPVYWDTKFWVNIHIRLDSHFNLLFWLLTLIQRNAINDALLLITVCLRRVIERLILGPISLTEFRQLIKHELCTVLIYIWNCIPSFMLRSQTNNSVVFHSCNYVGIRFNLVLFFDPGSDYFHWFVSSNLDF